MGGGRNRTQAHRDPRVRRSWRSGRGAEPQRIGSPLTRAKGGRLGHAAVKCGAHGAAVVDV